MDFSGQNQVNWSFGMGDRPQRIAQKLGLSRQHNYNNRPDPDFNTMERSLYRFQREAFIPCDADAYWLIKHGIVKSMALTEDGEVTVLGYWGPGNVVGQPLSLLDSYLLTGFTAVELYYVPTAEASSLSDEICQSVQQIETLFFLIRSERAYLRLYKVLFWLAKRFGREAEMGLRLELALTHQELADLIGVSRVTITRLLQQLAQDNLIIRPSRRVIIVRHPKGL